MKQQSAQPRRKQQTEMPLEQECQVWHDRRRAYVDHQNAQRLLRQQQAPEKRKNVLGWVGTTLIIVAFAGAAVWPVLPLWIVLALTALLWVTLYVLLRWLLPTSPYVCDACLAPSGCPTAYCPRCGRRQTKGLSRPWTTKHVIGLTFHLWLIAGIGTIALAIGRQVGWDAADQPELFWASVGLTFLVVGMVIGLKLWCDT